MGLVQPILFLVRIREHSITNHRRKIMAGRDELAESPPSWTERVELIDRDTVFGVCALEIREFQQKLIHDFGIDGLVDSWNNLDVTPVEADLPLVRRGDHDISPHEFAPMHMIAEGSRGEPNTAAALAKKLGGFF